MRITDLYVTGVGAHVPARVSTPDAVASGDYDAERAARDGIDAVGVATDLSAPEMAVLAGQEAVAMAGGADAAGVRMVLHSYVDYSGARFWDAAPYVALHTVGASVRGLDIRQSCNGSVASIELASYLVPRLGGSVLVTSAERFDTAGVSRWRADPQSVFGDGAGAAVLSGSGGLARVLAIATSADNRLEGESRGGQFRPSMVVPLDFEALREDYMREQVPLREHWTAMEQVASGALKEVLADAETSIDDIAYLVPINPTYPLLRSMLEYLIPLPESSTTWDIGQTIGHVGAADHLIGLHHLVTTGKAGPGDKILLAGGGTGFTATYVIIEMTRESPA